MDTLDIRNLQLSYQAVYDNTLCESMEDLGIIGEIEEERAPGVKPYRSGPTQAEVRADAARARQRHLEKSKGQKGYGDKVGSSPELTRRPDAETAEWLRQHPAKYDRITGEMGREWGSRQAAGVTRVVRGPGEPQAVTLPREKKKPKMVKRGGKWVKEALDYYDMILEYLLDEGYAETVENAEAIMVNMSEEWVGDIMEAMNNNPYRKITIEPDGDRVKQRATVQATPSGHTYINGVRQMIARKDSMSKQDKRSKKDKRYE